MEIKDFAKAQGHWILARMGKKVLRPGGKELTNKLIQALNICNEDTVVEFAPGIGYTADLVLKKNPYSYTGVDADTDVVANLSKKILGERRKVVYGNAAEAPVESDYATKVYGEAMLTMHVDAKKSSIIREAYRILKPGGLYAIHELGLTPDDLNEETKSIVQRELATSIHVNARPLTVLEWRTLLEKEGFEILTVETNGMKLLDPSRILDDEGFFRSLKIGFNILRLGKARKRILEMYEVFTKYANQMNAVVLVGRKPEA